MKKYILALDPSYSNFEISLFKENILIEQHHFKFNSKKMEEINSFFSIFFNKYKEIKPLVTIENKIPYLANNKNNQEKKNNNGKFINMYSQIKIERLRWMIIGILNEKLMSYELTYADTWRRFFKVNFPDKVKKLLEYDNHKNKYVWTKNTSYQLALLFKQLNQWEPLIKKDGESALIGYYKAIKSDYE